MEEDEEAEKLRCSWLDVEDSNEEETCGWGAQWSEPKPVERKERGKN